MIKDGEEIKVDIIKEVIIKEVTHKEATIKAVIIKEVMEITIHHQDMIITHNNKETINIRIKIQDQIVKNVWHVWVL
jgi:hypothetical protein